MKLRQWHANLPLDMSEPSGASWALDVPPVRFPRPSLLASSAAISKFYIKPR